MKLARSALDEGPYGLASIDFYTRENVDPDTMYVTHQPAEPETKRQFVCVHLMNGTIIADAFVYGNEVDEAKQWLLDMTRVKLI
jgi:hypothetical protein